MPPVQTFTARELKNKIGTVFSAANREPVGITRNGRFSYVLASAEYWDDMKGDELYTQYKNSHF